jgi:hypothetical protein
MPTVSPETEQFYFTLVCAALLIPIQLFVGVAVACFAHFGGGVFSDNIVGALPGLSYVFRIFEKGTAIATATSKLIEWNITATIIFYAISIHILVWITFFVFLSKAARLNNSTLWSNLRNKAVELRFKLLWLFGALLLFLFPTFVIVGGVICEGSCDWFSPTITPTLLRRLYYPVSLGLSNFYLFLLVAVSSLFSDTITMRTKFPYTDPTRSSETHRTVGVDKKTKKWPTVNKWKKR